MAKREVATPEIERIRWVGSDGSELVDGSELFDTKRGLGCQGATVGVPDAGGSTRCIPRRRAMHRGGGAEGPFSDPTCSTPAAVYGLTTACAKPEIGLKRNVVADAGACQTSVYFSVHTLGSEASNGFFQQAMSCVPTSNPSQTIWELGSEIPVTDFVEQERLLLGTGRVRAQASASQNVQLTAGAPFDTQSGDECYPTKIGADSYCVSDIRNLNEISEFEDSACTKPVVVVHSTCSPQVPRAAGVYTTSADGCEDVITEIHSLAPLAITQIYRKDDALCEPEPLVAAKAYAVGGVVDPSTLFSKVTFATE